MGYDGSGMDVCMKGKGRQGKASEGKLTIAGRSGGNTGDGDLDVGAHGY